MKHRFNFTGMVASLTPLPVIGVPVRASALDGMDSLLSIAQVLYFIVDNINFSRYPMSKVPVTYNSSVLSSNTSLFPKMGAWESRDVNFLSLDAYFVLRGGEVSILL